MASVHICTEPYSDIDYSLVDGRVRSFVCLGKKLYDEQDGTNEPGWMDRLVELVREYQLDVDSGTGLHAFVLRMLDDGILPPPARKEAGG